MSKTDEKSALNTPNSVTLPTENDISTSKAIMITLTPLFVGTMIGFAIFYFGDTEKYQEKIETISEFDAGWLYLGLVILGRTINYLNFYATMKYKKSLKGNLRANPFVYKPMGKNAPEEVVVVLEDEGDTGKFNRANRSVHHMVENFGGFIAGIFAAGLVFPFPTFVLICTFCIGRILHQKGYTVGYGKHAKGFVLSLISIASVEGLLLIVGGFSLFH